ncbi:protocadherin-16-like [Penaeus japonicus]|uniref:protocadherin-16-like n=1 Tax=Penaeus japonicus TaxID=27405 RepID=UPI001C70EC61|nr:protocadherin-16-like [Penaeus japonicus]
MQRDPQSATFYASDMSFVSLVTEAEEADATRLLSGSGVAALGFTEPRYCAVLSEDAPLAAVVTTVTAIHKHGETVKYTISGGNKEGLFTIDQTRGTITVAAGLDFELSDKHELLVEAEAGGEGTWVAVEVRVTDVNDNPPYFLNPEPQVNVVEEDRRGLPSPLVKVEASDRDATDDHGLLYTIRGDGVDGHPPSRAFFAINSKTGELHLLRPLDRDPPHGRKVWRVRVQVRDGQALWSRKGDGQYQQSFIRQPRSSKGTTIEAKIESLHQNTRDASDGSMRRQEHIIGNMNIGEIQGKRVHRNKHTTNGSKRDRKLRRTGGKSGRTMTSEARSHPGVSKSSWRYVHPHTHKSRLPFSSVAEGDAHPADNAAFEGVRKQENHRHSASAVVGRNGGSAKDHLRESSAKNNRAFKHGSLKSPHGSRHVDVVFLKEPGGDLGSSAKGKTWNVDIEKQYSSVNYHEPTNDGTESHSNGLHDYMSADSNGSREPVNFDFSDLYRPASVNSTLQHEPEIIDVSSAYETMTSDTETQHKPESYVSSLYEAVESDFPVANNSSCSTPREGQDEKGFQGDNKEDRLGPKGRVVHVVETVLTVHVKDINDNPPVFPNATLFGEVQENGPIGKYGKLQLM